MSDRSTQLSVVATKLVPPRCAMPWVERPRLLTEVGEPGTVPLSLVIAPAGFGKSTLVIQWLQNHRQSCAWLGLDAQDNEPRRFIHCLVAAVRRARPQLLDRLQQQFLQSAPPVPDYLLDVFIDELNTDGEPLILVLDDYHEISAEAVHELMVRLLDHLPANLSLLVTSRREPPWPLARLRARQQLTEIRAPALRFADEEAEALFHQRTGGDLSTSLIAELNRKTEGWVAGLHLAALSLRNEDDGDRFIRGFDSRDRFIADYLTEEVLARQDEATRRFLITTSILSRLNGSLAAAVSELDEAGEILLALERNNVFLFALDNQRQWYRYHHLFADLLRHQLARSGAYEVQAAHRRASIWYAQHDYLHEAVEHAFAGGDMEAVVSILDVHGMNLIRTLQSKDLAEWARRLPVAIATGNIDRTVTFLIADFIASGRINADWLDAAETLLAAQDQISPRADMERTTAILKAFAVAQSRDFTRAAALILAIDDKRSASDWPMLAELLMYARGTAAFWLRDLNRAQAELEQSRRLLLKTANAAAYFPVLLNLLAIYQLRGDQRAGAALLRAAYAEIQPQGWLESVGRGWLELGQGDLAFERDAHYLAKSAYEKAISYTRRSPTNTVVLLARARLAELAAIAGNQEQASQLADEVMQTEHIENVSILFALYDWRIGEMLLGLGRVSAAGDWLQHLGIKTETTFDPAREELLLVLARQRILSHAGSEVLPMLTNLTRAAEQGGRLRIVIEGLALQALAQMAAGHGRQAQELLCSSLQLAWPRDLRRLFKRDEPGMGSLLAAVDDKLPAAAEDFMQSLTDGPHFSTATTPGISEPLSPKERKVLELLAAGHSNQDISEQMFISLNTVKTHLKHIYVKLGVSSRAQAISRAQASGLLKS